ncbi:MAG: hypothetical protein SFX18_02670 [Pirellulales bacterium]|nr:hypothetical protein [Pirellulales bacterium]
MLETYHTRGIGGLVQREFDSLDDLANSVPAAQDVENKDTLGALFGQHNHSWIGRKFTGIDHAKQELHGHHKPTFKDYNAVKNALDSIELPMPVNVKRRLRWNEDGGDSLCVDRLRSGQPYWQECRRTATLGRSNVTLLCNTGAHCGVNSQDILWRGAACVALADWLESAGYSVRLVAAKYNLNSYTNGDDLVLSCVVKDYGQPVSESLLANALSGWAYRTMWFYAMSTEGRVLTDNLGFPRLMTDEIANMIEPGAILCQDLWAKEAAATWLLEQAAKFAENAAITAF